MIPWAWNLMIGSQAPALGFSSSMIRVSHLMSLNLLMCFLTELLKDRMREHLSSAQLGLWIIVRDP